MILLKVKWSLLIIIPIGENRDCPGQTKYMDTLAIGDLYKTGFSGVVTAVWLAWAEERHKVKKWKQEA